MHEMDISWLDIINTNYTNYRNLTEEEEELRHNMTVGEKVLIIQALEVIKHIKIYQWNTKNF